MRGAGDRFECELEVEGRLYRVSAAWRGPETGYGVLYFFPSDGADEAEGDRGDRRVLLTPEVSLPDLGESSLLLLYDSGRPLTETERRFAAADGRQWLAQSRGPVWAGRSGAEGGSGILFTSLEGKPESLRAAGGHVGEISDEELLARWRGAGQSPDAADRPAGELDERAPEERGEPA
jgi:hypothetical protein